LHILLTNDDGIHAPGLMALHKALRTQAKVSVVAPLTEQSGVAHSLTILQPLRVKDVHLEGRFFGHGVTGAPADCVRLAVKEILDDRPDYVISGINIGANTGLCVFYSGTVAGAVEAALLGIPAMAVSVEVDESLDMDFVAETAVKTLDILKAAHRAARKKAVVLNVNIPAVARGELNGVRITRQGRYGAEEGFERRRDPRGRAYYWISEEPAERSVEKGDDMEALLAGYVSVTPLQYDLTDQALHEQLSGGTWRIT
jgi:5'-nucleotidase